MGSKNRDDFTSSARDILAKRVGYRCSNPSCRRPTIGPNSNPNKATSVGVASHICAAAPGGPRYDESMSTAERTSLKNGIWLCQNCATIIDRDENKYTVPVLQEWKAKAEERAELNPPRKNRCLLYALLSIAAIVAVFLIPSILKGESPQSPIFSSVGKSSIPIATEVNVAATKPADQTEGEKWEESKQDSIVSSSNEGSGALTEENDIAAQSPVDPLENRNNDIAATYEWTSVESACAYFGNDVPDVLVNYGVYDWTEYYRDDFQPDQYAYGGMIALLAHFENNGDYEAYIDAFSVHVYDIVEDDTPVYSLDCDVRDESVRMYLTNLGWGPTEPLTVELKEITAAYSQTRLGIDEFLSDYDSVECSFGSLNPGDSSQSQELFPVDALQLNEIDFNAEFSESLYELVFELRTDSGFSKIYRFNLNVVYANGELTIEKWVPGFGPEDLTKYVLTVNTSKGECEAGSKTLNPVPAHEQTVVPLCIAPDQTCNMSVEVSFHIAGEPEDYYRTAKIENVRVLVPNSVYYRREIIDILSNEPESGDAGNYIKLYP